MKEPEFEDMETPEVRFTKLMKDYTTLKQQRLILLRGIWMPSKAATLIIHLHLMRQRSTCMI